MSIVESDGNYSVHLQGNITILLPFERKPETTQEITFSKLQECFPGDLPFSAKEARMALGLSLTSFQRLVIWAEERNFIRRVGSGPKTRYAMTNGEQVPSGENSAA